MKKILFVFLFCFFLIGCSSNEKNISSTKVPSEIKTTPISETMQEVLTLPLEERVGQMILLGFHGQEVTDELQHALTNEHIGNVILFSRNISSIKQTKQLNQNILSLNKEIPIWISLDAEGGNVSRLPSEVTKLSTARTLANNYTPQEVFNS